MAVLLFFLVYHEETDMLTSSVRDCTTDPSHLFEQQILAYTWVAREPHAVRHTLRRG